MDVDAGIFVDAVASPAPRTAAVNATRSMVDMWLDRFFVDHPAHDSRGTAGGIGHAKEVLETVAQDIETAQTDAQREKKQKAWRPGRRAEKAQPPRMASCASWMVFCSIRCCPNTAH